MRIPLVRSPRASHKLISGLAVALFLLAMPVGAQAAEDYTLQPYGTKCVSGQPDERQYSYTICWNDTVRQESYLRVDAPNGTRVAFVRMPGANDVAPAPDGSYVYVSGGSGNPLRKFVRTATGSYEQDYAWKPPTYVFDGERVPANGRQIATDGYGNLYVASGMWTGDTPGNVNLTHSVAKFDPSGKVLDVFGGYNNTWKTGRDYAFYSLGGIAVSRDGRYLYTTEVHNSRVQRFDRQADGTYKFAMTWGNNATSDPFRVGLCMPTMLAAPYDIAVDPWGDVWTTSTSCTYVQKFSKDGIWKFSSYVGNRGATQQGMLPNGEQERSHNIAVNAHGDVIAGENRNVLVRGGVIPPWPAIDAQPTPTPTPVPVPGPGPVPGPTPVPNGDVTAPTLRGFTIPATTASSAIDVAIDATDNVAVATVRMATDNGDDWTTWQPYAATMRFSLRAGTGPRGVYVQVRDAAGNESAIAYHTTNVTAQGPAPAPVPVPNPVPVPVPVPNPVPVPVPVPAPGPDVTDPVVRSVAIPATNVGSTVGLIVDATDNAAVTEMRMCDDYCLGWTPWVPYHANVSFVLRAGAGYRGVYVQVRDAAGNESGALYRTTLVTA
ncbi:MAG: putative repeat protein [Thermoleophilia bacterium]|nr:putative repeat protein [Thermoleophilia bacterium]